LADSNNIDSLSDEDIRRIAQLIEALERSSFDHLTLDVGGMKLTLGKGEPTPAPAPDRAVASPVAAAQVESPAPIRAAPVLAPSSAPATAAASAAVDDGTVAITAPVIGRFYAAPQPGAAPFVSVGDTVTADTTVGLVEVMKVFTHIPAGVDGVVTEVCAKTEQFVEFGELLFRVRQHARDQ
jgi:acetyl-CoA carboxylase biotin carboxyl carrier protein